VSSFYVFQREAAKLEIKVLEKIQQRDRNGRRSGYNLVDLSCVLHAIIIWLRDWCCLSLLTYQAWIIILLKNENGLLMG